MNGTSVTRFTYVETRSLTLIRVKDLVARMVSVPSSHDAPLF